MVVPEHAVVLRKLEQAALLLLAVQPETSKVQAILEQVALVVTADLFLPLI